MRKIILIIMSFPLGAISYAQMPDSLQQSKVIANKSPYYLSKKSLIELHVHKVCVKTFLLPGALITYGFISLGNANLKTIDYNTKREIEEDHPHPISKLDNYLQYSPALAVYALNTLGIKGKNNFRDRTIIYTLSTAISSAIVLPLKRITKVQRPDGSGFNSFPSGHTTTAFAAAEFMRQEYKDVSLWYGVAGYTAAAATGILRLYNNKHWVSDVIAGAGFGILSTKLSYLIYPSIKRKFFKNKSTNALVMPFCTNGVGGFFMVYNFKN